MNTNILDMETLALNEEERALVIIDQTKLPNRAEYLHLKTQGEIWTAIRELQVRGAPAIGDAGPRNRHRQLRRIRKTFPRSSRLPKRLPPYRRQPLVGTEPYGSCRQKR